MDLPPGRPGRARWAVLVRELLPQLAQPVAFARRVVDRACQTGGLMSVLLQPQETGRLPRKLTEKGYFNDACRLAELLGHDLHSLAGQADPQTEAKRRPRRRRRRRTPAQPQ
jgi:poly(A) polymerase